MNNDGIISMGYSCGIYLMEKGLEINHNTKTPLNFGGVFILGLEYNSLFFTLIIF